MGVQLWNYTLRSLIMVSLQDRKQPDVCDKFFHDVPFEAHFSTDIPELQSMTAMPGVDGFTMKVDALYKVCGTTCMSSVSHAPPLSCCMSSQTIFWRNVVFHSLVPLTTNLSQAFYFTTEGKYSFVLKEMKEEFPDTSKGWTENFLSAVNITLKWNIISVISTTSLS